MNPAGASVLTRVAGKESARKWTPAATAASAMSNRSLTSTRHEVPAVVSIASRTLINSDAAGKADSRTCTRSTPDAPAARIDCSDEPSPPVMRQMINVVLAFCDEETGQFRQPGKRGEAADSRDCAPHEHAREQRFKNRQTFDKEIPIPEGSLPGRDDQHEAGLEKIGCEQDAGNDRDDQPPVCTRASRSTRSATSRYSPAVACSSRNTASARAVSPASSSARPRSYKSACASSGLEAVASAARSSHSIASVTSPWSRYSRPRSAAASKRRRGDRAAVLR